MAKQMAHEKFLDFLESLKFAVVHRTNEIEGLRASLAKQPLNALAWASDAFDSAAELALAKEILAQVEKGATPEQILAQANDHVLRAAMYPSRSTSPCHKLAEQAKGAAWARIAEQLQAVLK